MLSLMTRYAWYIALATVVPIASAQCGNEVAAYHPNEMTSAIEATWFIAPAPKQAVLSALKQAYPGLAVTLLDVPSSNASLFPNGFPSGMHPVMASSFVNNDIRMRDLQIDGPLRAGAVIVPYVAVNGDGPVAGTLTSYITGTSQSFLNPLLDGIVPAVANPLLFGGVPLRLGEFVPPDKRYQSDNAGNLVESTKWALIPNFFSGPGVYPQAVDMLFKAVSTSKYTGKTFKTLINQPNLTPIGKCQRAQYYTSNASALPFFGNGKVTFGNAASAPNWSKWPTLKEILMWLTSPKSALQSAVPNGVYQNVDGYSACAQQVGFAVESCESALKNLDQTALA